MLYVLLKFLKMCLSKCLHMLLKNRRRNDKQYGQFTTNYMSMKNIFLFMKNTRILFKLPCLPHVKYRNLETYKQVNKRKCLLDYVFKQQRNDEIWSARCFCI